MVRISIKFLIRDRYSTLRIKFYRKLTSIKVLVSNFYKGVKRLSAFWLFPGRIRNIFLLFNVMRYFGATKCVNGTEIPAARKTHASCRCLCLSDCIAASSSTIPRCSDYKIYGRENRQEQSRRYNYFLLLKGDWQTRLIIVHPAIDSDINHNRDFIRSIWALSSAIYLM